VVHTLKVGSSVKVPIEHGAQLLVVEAKNSPGTQEKQNVALVRLEDKSGHSAHEREAAEAL